MYVVSCVQVAFVVMPTHSKAENRWRETEIKSMVVIIFCKSVLQYAMNGILKSLYEWKLLLLTEGGGGTRNVLEQIWGSGLQKYGED